MPLERAHVTTIASNYPRALAAERLDCAPAPTRRRLWTGLKRMQDFDDIPKDPGTARRLNVLYLISELEAAIDLGGVTWTAEDTESIPQRLANISSALRRQAGN